MKKDNCWSQQSPEKSTVPFFLGHPVYISKWPANLTNLGSSCTQVCGCNGCCVWLWLWTGWSPSIFSWFGIIYFLFPNMKKHLAGKEYRTEDELISAVEDFFKDQDESFYTTGIQHRWKKCVDPGETMLKNKPHVLVKFDHCIIVSLWHYIRPSFTVSRLSRRNFSWSGHYSKSLSGYWTFGFSSWQGYNDWQFFVD